MTRTTLISLLMLLLVSTSTLAQKVITWSDDNGMGYIADSSSLEEKYQTRVVNNKDPYATSVEQIRRDIHEVIRQSQRDRQETEQQITKDLIERQRDYVRIKSDIEEQIKTEHNLYCEQMIRFYQNKKQALLDKLKHSHSRGQRQRWNSQINNCDVAIKYWRNKMI